MREQKIEIGQNKCKIGLQQVNYIGHIITNEGLKASPTKITAVQKMQQPHDKGDVQRFLGLVTYLIKFIPNMLEVTTPLRKLLASDVEWHWDKQQQKCFEALKSAITSSPVLCYCDPEEQIRISVDASSMDLRAVLLQGGHTLAYASKALTQTEKNYAQIEKDMLAIVFGCTRFHKLIYGRHNVIVESDHKPLETIW